MRLERICIPVELMSGQQLEPAVGSPDKQAVYFLDGCTVALWIHSDRTEQGMAVALVGSEGMVGCSHLWPQMPTPWVAKVLTPGKAWAAEPKQLHKQLLSCPPLAMALSQCLWRQTQEIAQLSARMQLGDLRSRVALWLHLMLHKTGQHSLPVTHDALARMLGTRRVSITLIAGELQNEGVIALSRGNIEIKDAQALTQIAHLETV